MESSRRQNLVRCLKEVADSSVEELNSCPCRLLQDAQDNIRKANSKAGTSSSTSRGIISQPVARDSPSTISSTVGRAIPQPDASGSSLEQHSTKPTELVQSTLNKLSQILELLKRDVEEILRYKLRQNDEDPRIDDIARTIKPSISDKLRSVLSLYDRTTSDSTVARKRSICL